MALTRPFSPTFWGNQRFLVVDLKTKGTKGGCQADVYILVVGPHRGVGAQKPTTCPKKKFLKKKNKKNTKKSENSFQSAPNLMSLAFNRGGRV